MRYANSICDLSEWLRKLERLCVVQSKTMLMNMKGGFVGSGQGIMYRLTCMRTRDKRLGDLFVYLAIRLPFITRNEVSNEKKGHSKVALEKFFQIYSIFFTHR